MPLDDWRLCIQVGSTVDCCHLASGEELAFDTRCPIMDLITDPGAMGEVTVQVPESVVGPCATVLAINVAQE